MRWEELRGMRPWGCSERNTLEDHFSLGGDRTLFKTKKKNKIKKNNSKTDRAAQEIKALTPKMFLRFLPISYSFLSFIIIINYYYIIIYLRPEKAFFLREPGVAKRFPSSVDVVFSREGFRGWFWGR